MNALTLTPKYICTCCFTVLHTSLDKILSELRGINHSIHAVHVASNLSYSDRDRIRDNVLSHANVCTVCTLHQLFGVWINTILLRNTYKSCYLVNFSYPSLFISKSIEFLYSLRLCLKSILPLVV